MIETIKEKEKNLNISPQNHMKIFIIVKKNDLRTRNISVEDLMYSFGRVITSALTSREYQLEWCAKCILLLWEDLIQFNGEFFSWCTVFQYQFIVVSIIGC